MGVLVAVGIDVIGSAVGFVGLKLGPIDGSKDGTVEGSLVGSVGCKLGTTLGYRVQ